MALLETHFYNQTIHLYTSVFGTLFNDIKILRSDGKTIKVPLSYAGQQKENTRVQQNPDPNEARYKKRLPRLSYALRGWQKDTTRVTNRNHKLADPTANRSVDSSIASQYNRIPYNFEYELRAQTKHVDDMLQIVEQILVSFNPALEVVVEDNPDINGSTALLFTLNDSALEDNFEGQYEEARIIEASFNFTLEGYLYMPAFDDASIIKTINLKYYDLENPDDMLEQTTITG